jgi:Holliday junction DNA helicase RuvA
MLVSAHGVGPTLALAVLATHDPSTLMEIIAAQDIASLTLVPGVGKKTAERLLVELKSRVVPLDSLAGASGSTFSSSSADVRQALSSLGYSEGEIRDAMREIDPHGSSSDQLRDALRVLGVRRA